MSRDDDRSPRRGRDDDDRPARRTSSQDDDRPARRNSRDDDDRGSRRGREEDDRPARRGRGDDDGGGRSMRDGRRSFTYTQRDSDQVRKRAEQSASDYDKIIDDRIKMYKVADGANTIRYLPPTWDKPDHYGLDIYVHYGVGPDRGTYLCLNKMKGEPCPVCEERTEAQRTGDEKYAKELEPKKRVLCYLIDRDHEKDGVQAWASPWTVDRDVTTVSRDRRTGEVYAIDHPDDGYDVEFEKKGSKDRTEYMGVAIARRSSPLGKDEWLDFAIDNPLPGILRYFDYDHIAKVFNGGGASRGGNDSRRDERGGRDDDDRPGRRDRNDSRDDRPQRDADRGDDRGGSGRGGSSSLQLTWDDVHGMKSSELDDLVDLEKLSLNPAKFDSDEDLATAICEELGIKKAARRGRDDDDDKPARRSSGDDAAPVRRRASGDDDDDRDGGRLAEMRRNRER